MNKIKFSIVIALLTQALVACDSDNKPQHSMPPMPVDFSIVSTMDIPVVSKLTGRATSVKTAEVRPQVSGIVMARLFKEGAFVQKGDQLYQIDPAVYKAQLESAKAELAKADANKYSSKLRYDRYKSLIESKSISQQELDDAEANYKSALANYLSAEAAVKTAEINLGYTKVYAPISGIISRSNITEGALVTNGQSNPLATIQQLDPIYVDLGQTVKDHISLKKNIINGTFTRNNEQLVDIYLENGEKYGKQGKLEFSEVKVDESTGMVTVRVIVPNEDTLLLPGMYIRAEINEGIQKDSIVIPQIAVQRQNNGTSTVYTVETENCAPTFEYCVGKQIINIIGEIDNYYIISSGVEKGKKIITSNIQKIGPGAPITPISTSNK